MKNLIIIFILLLSLALAPCLFAEGIGKVVSTQGRVDIFKDGSQTAIPAREDDSLSIGDSIRTKSGSKAQVIFSDKSVLKLAQNSKVLIKDYQLDDKERRTSAVIELSRGKARAIIAKTPSGASFVIKTPNAEGTVKGSDVTAFYQAGNSGMFVSEGKLSVINIAHPDTKIIVPKGNACVIPMGELPKGPRPYLDVEKKLNEEDTYVPVSISKTGKVSVIKGAVAKVSGMVNITPKGSAEAHKASINDILGEGDRIETGENGYIEVRLDNNNAINLKPNTKLTIIKLIINPETGEFDNIFEVTLGNIKARIENLKGNSKFEVKTPQAVCGARGTIMYISVLLNATTSFFEGGNGYMENTLSGATQNVGAGQRSTSDDAGAVTIPIYVSDNERQSYGEGWDGAAGYEGYSSSNNEGYEGLFDSGNDQGLGPIGLDGTEQQLESFFIGIPFSELPVSESPSGETSPLLQATSFSGSFGSVTIDYLNDIWQAFMQDTAGGIVNGYFIFGLPNTPDWSGQSTYSYMVASYLNPENNILWTGDIQGTAYDGGTYKGWIGGRLIDLDGLKQSDGKVFGIYMDPTGNAGTFSSYFSNGTYDSNIFFGLSDSIEFIKRKSSIGILPQDLFTANIDESRLEATGTGGFFGVEGAGSIDCELLGGTGISLYGEKWGVLNIEAKGTYSDNISNDWSLALGGKSINASDGGESYWLGTMASNSQKYSKWESGGLENAFRGIYFDKDDSTGNVRAGIIDDGDVLGHYWANSDYYLTDGNYAGGNWQAIGGGVWYEVTDILDEHAMFGESGIGALSSFVNVPITQLYSAAMTGTGTGGIGAVSMNMNLYATSPTAFNGIWTAFINGAYSITPDSVWTANVTREGGSVDLTGQTWKSGQWTALVTGTVNNSSIINGQAGGTYTTPDESGGGTFAGVGAGTWDIPR